MSAYGSEKSVVFSLDGVEGVLNATNLTLFDEVLLTEEKELKERKRFDLGDLEEIMKRLMGENP